MKTIIPLFFGFLVSIQGFCQSEGFEIESEQLADNFVIITVKGPTGVYSSYLCEGNENEFEAAAYVNGELNITQNSRDNFIENIDMGLLPSDILYHSGFNENVIVYGGKKILILDGDNHTSVLKSFELNEAVNNYHMAFMPIAPLRYQLSSFYIKDSYQELVKDFVFCASEGGGLYIINSEGVNDFSIFQVMNDEKEMHLLSSSIRADFESNYLIWVLNYWDGMCKIKKIVWDALDNKFKIDQEKSWINNEIIDFYVSETYIRIALLNNVLDLDANSFNDNATYNNLSIDKLEDSYGHIKDEKSLFLFGTNTTFSPTEPGMIDLAFSSCFDPDNGRVYFTGYFDDELEPGFRVINYNPYETIDPFKSSALSGALDVEFNPKHGEDPFYCTVFATGRDNFVGFNNEGYLDCQNSLDCHFGFRIAIDLNLCPPETNGTLVACIKDGMLVQFRRMGCASSEYYRFIGTGISSSLSCYNEVDKKAYFFYNGDGGNGTYMTYDEVTHTTSSSFVSNSSSFFDCIYNKESNLVLAQIHDHCQDYIKILKISNGDFVFLDQVFSSSSLFTNYNEFIYCYLKEDNNHKLYRIWGENGQNSESIELDYAVKALDFNKADGLIYGICDGDQQGYIMVADHNNFTTVTPQFNGVLLNSPSDISYISESEKIYITQYEHNKIQVFNEDFNLLKNININGKPKKIEYNPYQNKAFVISDIGDNGFTKITIINCSSDGIINEKVIRRSDGYVFDTINDQLYFQTNYPALNSNGLLEYNIKALNCFDNNFSNQVNTDLYTYSDIFLSKKRNIPSKPSYNCEDNYIYFGNYGSASASKIKAFYESLTFKPGWKWISFPRMERYKDEIFVTIPLLERIDPWPADYLKMIYEPTGITPQYIEYNEGWNSQSNLTILKSSQGYKLNYQKSGIQNCTIRMEGAKLDYNTSIDLNVGENWIGYFLDQNLYPEQCLPANIWEALVQIKTQYWTMTKVASDPPWFLQGKKTPFKYGDLVILKTNHPYTGFQWQNQGTGTSETVIPQTTYYSFNEQSDYLPFYVEMDSNSQIMEIAVLTDGIVKGAAVRAQGDTLVEVNGYLEGVPPGAVIEFETWDGYKSEPIDKRGYVVVDHQRSIREKRSIYAGEKADYYHVSLKSKELYELPLEISIINCQPNPFSQSIEFSFRMNKGNYINLEIYNMSGNRVTTIIAGNYPEGYYRFTWSGENEAGGYIAPGIYFYRMSTGNGTVMTDKIVMVNTE